MDKETVLIVGAGTGISASTPVRPECARRDDLSLERHLRIGSKRLARGICVEKLLRGDLIRHGSQLLGRVRPDSPFGGVKDSGHGSEDGLEGVASTRRCVTPQNSDTT
jgi:hypothetical protein